MKKRPTILQTMPNLLVTGGIFNYMPLYGDMTAAQMGILYGSKKAGTSYAAPLVRNYAGADGTVNATGEAAIGLLLTNIFKHNWDQQWAALNAVYELLDNVTENTSNTVTHTGKDTDVFGNKRHVIGQQIFTNGEKVLREGEVEDHIEHNKAAYDNANYSPDSEDVNKLDERVTTNEQSTDTSGQRIDSDDQYTDEHTKGTTDTTTIFRHGNIGITSSQQMITQELELRKYDFFDEMFNDIDKYLCLHVR